MEGEVGAPLMSGYLDKLSPRKKTPLGGQRWQTRYFILTPRHLRYYKTAKKKGAPPPDGTVEPQGTISLVDVACARLQASKSDSHFQIVCANEGGRIYGLCADSANSARQWVNAINQAMEALPSANASNESTPTPPPSLTSRPSKRSGTKTKPTPATSLSRKDTSEALDQSYELIAGEKVLHKLGLANEDRVFYTHHLIVDCQEASVWLTNYRLIFFVKNQPYSVPLGIILKYKPKKHDVRNATGFAFKCKDFRCIMAFCERNESLKTLTSYLKKHFCPARIGDLFAYQSNEKYDKVAQVQCNEQLGLCLYDVQKEFKRQQVPAKLWRVTAVNSNFPSPINPSHFVVPRAITDETLIQCWKFKHPWQQLVASLCWYNAESGASLLRALPPLLIEEGSSAGLFDAQFVTVMSKQKEQAGKPLYLIEHLAVIHSRVEEVHLVRTMIKKKVAGAGDVSNVEGYPPNKTVFERDIPLMTPTVVEESLLELANAISSFDAHRFMENSRHADGWRETVAKSQWLAGIRGLILTTAKVITQLQMGNPVVVTSDDGFGSVPQIVSLAQVWMDPHFRTIEGFCLLVEKEWMNFAHDWGQSSKYKYTPKLHSAVFVQFIDSVWQIWTQWPEQFEFSTNFLIFLLESVYSCRFGSFLANTQYDRIKSKLNLCKLPSVWSYAIANKSQFVNQHYIPPTESKLVPRLTMNPSQVSFWSDYYLRWVTFTSESPEERIRARLSKCPDPASLQIDSLALPSVSSSDLDLADLIDSLSVANNFIPSLSTCILHFTRLTSLDLSHNLLTSWTINTNHHHNELLSRFTKLQSLDLSHNLLWSLELLPVSLNKLNVSYNRIGRLPRCMSSLTNLHTLDISYNSLVNNLGEPSLPEAILHMTSLTSLNVAGNMLKSIHEDFFSSLERLEELNLSCNSLAVLPKGLSRCSHLRVLSLSDNPFSSLPKEIAKLTDLEELYLRKCLHGHAAKSAGSDDSGRLKLDDLDCLTNLRTLDLCDNGIDIVPKTVPARLTRLQKLWLSNNNLTSLPSELSQMTALEELQVAHNKLDHLPAELAKLKLLQRLTIEDNMISELPVQFGLMTSLKELIVDNQNGRLRSPPMEVVARGSESIIAYLGQLLKGQEPCNRMKLMFVGQENVGKTSLLLALQKACGCKITDSDRARREGQGTLLSTDGIDITKWSLPTATGSIDLSAWDFAGQEVYYTTHEFFLSERSIYLVIFNPLALTQSRIDYWLQSVNLATKGSPILLIGTHADSEQCTTEFLAQIQAKLEPLRRQYSNIAGFHFVSCSTNLNMDKLISSIQSIISTQDYVGQMLPSSYLALEKLIETRGRTKKPPILNWEEYTDMAKLCLIDDSRDDLRTATALLHTLGSIVHFAKEEKLQDMVILDPQWLMDVMATILSTKHNYCRDGILRREDLLHIWKAPDYPLEMHPFLLALLERFEIIFPLQSSSHMLKASKASIDKQVILVPSILPTSPAHDTLDLQWPETLGKKEQMFGRFYHFQFIPKGFMGRLLIRMLAFPITAHAIWRYGMLSSLAKELIMVELDPDGRLLKIMVRTSRRGEQMSNLCWLIFSAIDSLVKEWYNLKTQVYVPCPHCMSLGTKSAPHLFPLKECQMAAVTPSNAFLSCPHIATGGKLVRLDNAAPDLAMVHLDRHKVQFSELDKEAEPIGEGGYAFVYRGKYRDQEVAIKVLKSIASSSELPEEGKLMYSSDLLEAFEEFRHEVWIMSGLAHPNLVAMVGFCTEPACLITEFIPGGSLHDYIQDASKPLNWPLRLKIAKDIAKGCAFLHSTSPPVMHRDLKSPNILLVDVASDAEVVAKVCDFGVSLNAVFQAHGRRVDCPVWLAPEVVANKPYTEKCDVYSIGVILWELLTRKTFFGEIRFMSQLEDAVLSGQRPPIPSDCISSYRALIEECWNNDPDIRPTCDEIVKRVEGIMKEMCPDAANYDQDVDWKFQEKLKKDKAKTEKKPSVLKKDKDPAHRKVLRALRRVPPLALLTDAQQQQRPVGSFVGALATLHSLPKEEISKMMCEFKELQHSAD